MEIVQLDKKYCEDVKDLLVELQKYIIEIDNFKLNILSKSYREKYFEYMLLDCKNNAGKVFVATENNRVVGMIAGFIQNYDSRDSLDYACPKKGIVAELIVSKTARCKGAGMMLLKKMEQYFQSLNCKYCQIEVFAPNETAKKFYYKNGYEDRMLTLFKKL